MITILNRKEVAVTCSMEEQRVCGMHWQRQEFRIHLQRQTHRQGTHGQEYDRQIGSADGQSPRSSTGFL